MKRSCWRYNYKDNSITRYWCVIVLDIFLCQEKGHLTFFSLCIHFNNLNNKFSKHSVMDWIYVFLPQITALKP